MIDYRNDLNPAQFEAATSLEGPLLVIAGAGSGKTRTIVYRLARLVESGAPASSILLLTFFSSSFSSIASNNRPRREKSKLNRSSLSLSQYFRVSPIS